MEREIKFRLLNNSKEPVGYCKWYVGFYCEDTGYSAKPEWLYSTDGKYWNPEAITHRYKRAYTGYADKNKNEVYEGDKVKGFRVIEGREYMNMGEFLTDNPTVTEGRFEFTGEVVWTSKGWHTKDNTCLLSHGDTVKSKLRKLKPKAENIEVVSNQLTPMKADKQVA